MASNNDVIKFSDIPKISQYIEQCKAFLKVLQSDEALDFMAKKIELELDSLINNASTLNQDLEEQYVHTYRTGNVLKIDYSKSTIEVSNSTVLPLDPSTWGSQKSFAKAVERYPNMEIDLAKLVEYGTGIVGASSQVGDVDGWQYMMNPDRDYNKPWAYRSTGGSLVYTRGMEGKFIYYKLEQNVKEKAGDWVEEYLRQKELID